MNKDPTFGEEILDYQKDSKPVKGDDRLIILIKKFYMNTKIKTETIEREEIEFKYVPLEQIPPEIKSYENQLPIILKIDPVVQEYEKANKSIKVKKGDAFVFRRLYEDEKSIYWRVVK